MHRDEIVKKALQSPRVQEALRDKKIEKIVYIPNRLINFVTRENKK